jgi:hypothetical protein
MEKSETIVADPTCGMGNHLHVSSGDNVLASASWGRAGGLAICRAATLRNHCSVVRSTTWTRFKWKKVGVLSFLALGESSTPEQVRMNALGATPRRMDGGTMVKRTEMQGRDAPHSISVAAGMRDANSSCVWECGTAHEAILAVKPVITSRASEGPLGFRGRGVCEGLGYCPNGLQDLKAKPSHANCDEAHGKPENREGCE